MATPVLPYSLQDIVGDLQDQINAANSAASTTTLFVVSPLGVWGETIDASDEFALSPLIANFAWGIGVSNEAYWGDYPTTVFVYLASPVLPEQVAMADSWSCASAGVSYDWGTGVAGECWWS